MTKGSISVALVILALTASPGRAEQSEEYRDLVAALETRLKALELEKFRCVQGLRAANQQAWESLDRAERRMYANPRGGLTGREEIELDQAKRTANYERDKAVDCEKKVETERANIRAILSSPERLRIENEKLQREFPRELLALLADARSASTTLRAGSSYDEFALSMGAIGSRIQSIRSQYAVPLNRGDHKALGVAISDACTTLYAAESEWKLERQAAKEVAEARARVDRATPWQAEGFEARLKKAQREHEEAQKRLADQKETALRMVQEAMRVAQEDLGG